MPAPSKSIKDIFCKRNQDAIAGVSLKLMFVFQPNPKWILQFKHFSCGQSAYVPHVDVICIYREHVGRLLEVFICVSVIYHGVITTCLMHRGQKEYCHIECNISDNRYSNVLSYILLCLNIYLVNQCMLLEE